MAMRVLNYVNGKRIEIKFQDPSEKKKKTRQSKKKLESDGMSDYNGGTKNV